MSLLEIRKMFNKVSSAIFNKAKCEEPYLYACKSEPKITPKPIDLDLIKESISKMTVEEMYSKSKFSVWQEEDGKWYVYMSLCQLGGCDFDGVPHETEREALEEAVLLTLQGKKPDYHACPTCYGEYMKDCI